MPPIKDCFRDAPKPFKVPRLSLPETCELLVCLAPNPEVVDTSRFPSAADKSLYQFTVYDYEMKKVMHLMVGGHAMNQYRQFLNRSDRRCYCYVDVIISKRKHHYSRYARTEMNKFQIVDSEGGANLSGKTALEEFFAQEIVRKKNIEAQEEREREWQKKSDAKVAEFGKNLQELKKQEAVALTDDPIKRTEHFLPVGSCVTEESMEAAAYDQMEHHDAPDEVEGIIEETPPRIGNWDEAPERPPKFAKMTLTTVLEMLWDLQHKKGCPAYRDPLLARYKELTGCLWPIFMR